MNSESDKVEDLFGLELQMPSIEEELELPSSDDFAEWLGF